MTPLELYLWTRLDGTKIALTWLCILMAVGVILFAVTWMVSCEYGDETMQARVSKYAKRCGVAFGLFLAMNIAIPSKTDVATIYGLTWATNNEALRALPNEAVSIIRQWLNQARPDTTGKKP